MKIRAFELTKESFSYFFSHKYPIIMAILGTCIALLSTLFFEHQQYTVFAGGYWYEICNILVLLMWQLWTIALIISEKMRKKVLFFSAGKKAVLALGSLWWLVLWLIFLQWSGVSLSHDSYCYNESVDLSLALLLGVINGVQMIFNFCILPAAVDGERSLRKLLVSATDTVIKYGITIIGFFIFFALFSVLLFIVTGQTVSFLQVFFADNSAFAWYNNVFKLLWVYSTSYISFAFLCVAQTLFYLDKKRV